MPEPRAARWHAVWAKSAYNDHEEFYGTKLEVIRWARPRCHKILIWNETLRDIEPLRVDAEEPE